MTHHADETALRLVGNSTDSPHAPGRSFRASGSDPRRSVHSDLMDRIDGIRSAFPLRLAQTYEPERIQRARPIASPQAMARMVAADAPAKPVRTEALSRLVAGRVDVPISFAEDQAAAAGRSGGPLTMYAHPADRNTAATGVTIGRMLDVTA